jgi:hypothetical protein
MQPESKPLSIPDFNPLPMRTIQILTLTACCLLISFYSYSQNLQFNSAVFNEYGGGFGNSDPYFDVVTIGTLTVGANQVLKITNAGGAIGGPNNFLPVLYVLINGKVITGNETYLPAGTYSVGFSDYSTMTGEVKGFISGVLYDIVP